MRAALLAILVGCSAPSHALAIDGAPPPSPDGAPDDAPPPPLDAPLPAFTVEPPAITVGAGMDQIFVAVGATGPVVWTADAGTIDAMGRFVAPSIAPATPVHVTATALADGATAAATVAVVDQQLVLLTGATGGMGNLDGIGTAARFETGDGALAYDAVGGALYLSSSYTKSIRRVDLATNAVTTVATRPFVPHVLAVDPVARVLYLLEYSAILRLDLATGASDVLAGQTGVFGTLDGPGAAATFDDVTSACVIGRTLYVVERDTPGSVRTIDLAAGTHDVATFVGGLTSPTTLACTPTTIYVGDTAPNAAGTRISAIDIATREVTPLAFGPAIIGGTPSALAVADGGATLLAIDEMGAAVFAIDLLAGVSTVVAGDAAVTGMHDGVGANARLGRELIVVTDGGSQAWIADLVNTTIRALDLPSATLTTIAGSARLSATGTADGAFADARFETPEQLAVDPLGRIAVVDHAAVRLLDLATSSVTTATPVAYSAGASFTPDDTLYFSGASSIYDLAAGASAPSLVFGTPGMPGNVDGVGTNARFECMGPLAYVGGGFVMADCVANTIRLLDLATDRVTTVAGSGSIGEVDGIGTAASFAQPYGIASDGVHLVWIAEYRGSTIRQLDVATGEVTTLAGLYGIAGSADGTGASARFVEPYALAYDGHGSLYVADYGSYTVRRIWIATGAVSTIVGTPARHGISLGPVAAASIDLPFGVAVAPSGQIVLTCGAAVLAVTSE